VLAHALREREGLPLEFLAVGVGRALSVLTGHDAVEVLLARLIRRLELVTAGSRGRARAAGRGLHGEPALGAVTADLRVGHVDAVLAHALRERPEGLFRVLVPFAGLLCLLAVLARLAPVAQRRHPAAAASS
jgi:hypothetical protein